MSQRKYILLPIVLMFWTVALYAGDEDMSPSAYHVFDPETGYMITVDPLAEEQQVPPAIDVASPDDKTKAPEQGQYWIAALLIASGFVYWLNRRRESQN